MLKMMGQAMGRKSFAVVDNAGRFPFHHAVLSGECTVLIMYMHVVYRVHI